MKKIVPFFPVILLVFASCRKSPEKLIVPASQVNYSVNDSMHLSAVVISNYPDFHSKYTDKTYARETSKVKSYFKVEGPDIILVFEDTSVANLGSKLSIKIPNKTLSTISGNYLSQNDDIFFNWVQSTSETSAVFSNYAKADTCSLQIAYDSKTKTLSGAIAKLKYSFGLYIPYYQAGSTIAPGPNDAVFLASGGSFRQHAITFQYMASL
ncbi:MAG: hypothetical protein HYZ15_12475 [Sphingobacteriales bacterium]|nr:hypothetical protein [Sphingobacteriales bacterium]